jgi:hypothetical protein
MANAGLRMVLQYNLLSVVSEITGKTRIQLFVNIAGPPGASTRAFFREVHHRED